MKGIEVDFRDVEEYLQACDMSEMMRRIEASHDMLEKRQGLGREMLGWLDLPEKISSDEINKIKDAAKKIRNQSDILVVIGIGGSELGSRAVTSLFKDGIPKKRGPEIVYVGNNLSARYLRTVIEKVSDKDFSLCVISKSGKTLEPAIAFRMFKLLIEQKYGISGAVERIFIVTDPENGALKQIADNAGYETFVIPKNVGGRYSVLSACGLLPISVAGIDIEELLDGAMFASHVYNTTKLEGNDSYKYALVRNLLYTKGKDIEVFGVYEPFLSPFTSWLCQLFGESEGKNMNGIFPTGLTYTTDLHSMGQLMQEGKRNVFETVINIEQTDETLKVPCVENMQDDLKYIENMDISYINLQALNGTRLAHTTGGVPYIQINMEKLTEYNVGQIIYFFEKACAMSGYLMGVNPFNQPGVEEYKQNMRALLEEGNN